MPVPKILPGSELGRRDRGGEFLEQRLAVAAEPEQQIGHEDRHEPRQRAAEVGLSSASISGSRGHSGSDDSTSVAPSLPPSTLLISRAAAVTIGSSVLEPGGISIDSRMMPSRMPLSAPARAAFSRVARIGAAQHRGARHGGERIARIVIAVDRILQRVEHLGAVGDRAAHGCRLRSQ